MKAKYLFGFFFLILFISGCTKNLSEPEKIKIVTKGVFLQEGLRFEGATVEDQGVEIAFYSDKHVDIHEARRMIVAILYFIKEEGFKEDFEKVELNFAKDDGYICQAFYRKDKLFFYVWDGKENLVKKIAVEPFEGALERSFGSITREMTPYNF